MLQVFFLSLLLQSHYYLLCCSHCLSPLLQCFFLLNDSLLIWDPKHLSVFQTSFGQYLYPLTFNHLVLVKLKAHSSFWWILAGEVFFLNQAFCFFTFQFQLINVCIEHHKTLHSQPAWPFAMTRTDQVLIFWFSCSFQYLPRRLWSMHVPFINAFPSGQAHVAPEGLSKQMNSHVRSKQGLGTV